MSATAELSCDGCGKGRGPAEPPLKRCAGCYDTFYCSKECQSGRWGVHRAKCRKDKNLLRAYYSADGLTLTFTLENLMTQVLLPEPGAPNFWQDHMGEWADGRGYGRDHLFKLQLKPRQPNGCEGTFALGRPTSHGNLEWNEQGAIVISLAGEPLTTLCSHSSDGAPLVEAKGLTRLPHNAGSLGHTPGLRHRLVCNGCLLVWPDAGGQGCGGGTATTPALQPGTLTYSDGVMNVQL